MRIQPVQRDHLPAWKRLRQALYAGAAAAIHDREMQAILTSPDMAAFLVLAEDGEPVGLLELSVRNIVDGCGPGPVGYVEGIYLEPLHRGRGWGRRLLEHAGEWCQQRGCRELATDAELDNIAAQDLYRRLEFQETGRIVGFKKPLLTSSGIGPPVMPVASVRLWHLFAYFVGSLVLTWLTVFLIWPEWWHEDPRPRLPDAAMELIWYGLLLLLLRGPLHRSGASVRSLLTPGRERTQILWAMRCAVPLFATSLGCIYALYLPLSMVAPDFVTSWLLEGSELFAWSGPHHRLANLISLVVMAGMAPFVEEVYFRRLLLPACSAKWGARAAVIGTSAVFALLHADLLGAMVFSVILSLVFLRTGSIFLPFVIHATFNGMAAFWALWESLHLPAGEMWSLAEFQTSWWMGALGLLVGAPWLGWEVRAFLRRTA